MEPHTRVAAILRDVAAVELMPRFRRLAAHEIREKSPGEVVTEADLAAERAIVARLAQAFPGVPVIAEEACARDPGLLEGLARRETAFVVDPLDGTEHFARGEETFGIMAALLHRGLTQSAWIHLPLSGRSLFAQRGCGAELDGVPIRVPAAPPLASACGTVLTRFLPDALRGPAEAARATLRSGTRHRCAAQRTFDLVAGREHFALYYRTLPWDHAAGALIVEEAGGVARRYDGRRFEPADPAGEGLLIAADAALWSEVHARLLPSLPRVTL